MTGVQTCALPIYPTDPRMDRRKPSRPQRRAGGSVALHAGDVTKPCAGQADVGATGPGEEGKAVHTAHASNATNARKVSI